MNVIALTGNLGADPELRTTPQGKSVATINLAVRDDFDKDKTYWFKVVFWEKQAETLCTYLHKGSKIGVVGKLTSRDYTDKEGNKRNAVEIVANRFEFLDKKSDARSTNDFSVVDDDGDLPF